MSHPRDLSLSAPRRFPTTRPPTPVHMQERAGLVVDGYAQDAWVAAQRHQDAPWAELVILWMTYHRHLARVMAAAPPADRLRVRVQQSAGTLPAQRGLSAGRAVRTTTALLMRRLAIAVLLVALPSLRAAAQTPDDSGYVHVSPAVGVHYGRPLGLSVAAGGLFDFRGPHNDGVIAMVEMGQGGGEASLGYFRMIRFGQGFDVRLAGIRTGTDPRNASPETTYLGAEAHLMFLLGVGGRIGWFRRATPYSGPNRHDNVGSFGVSIGL